MTADGAGRLPTTHDESVPGDRSIRGDGLNRSLRGGADAVFVVRVDDGGDLVAELANETARLLFGIASDDGAAPALGTSCPASARPILHSLEQAATRSRATRETLMLPAPDGGRIAQRSTRSDSDGIARVPLRSRGTWYVKFINMIPTPSDTVDYESKWATLTFQLR